MVLHNTPVTIRCQGPADAAAYKIYKLEAVPPSTFRTLPKIEKTNTLYIQEMIPDQTGLYCCFYQSGEHKSQLSDPLRLVMTGEWDPGSRASGDRYAEGEPGSEIQNRKQQSLYL